MNYIGPFFRMSTLSCAEMESELFNLAKEAIKHIELQSRCGILPSGKLLKKALSTNDINILKDFSPVGCIYKKSHPVMIKSGKHPFCWDNETTKKEISPDANALLTYSLLELSSYYSYLENVDTILYSLSSIYKGLSRIQLDFYSLYMRNCDGLFVDKKNDGDSYTDSMSISDKYKNISYSYQAFMMCAYYDYYHKSKTKENEMYKTFSLEILNMLLDYKDSIYQESLEENLKICLSLNMFFNMSHDDNAKLLLIDLCDILIDLYNDNVSDYSTLANKSLLSINLFKAYEYTNIYKFKETADEICSNIVSLYDKDIKAFKINTDKKEVKYTSSDLTFCVLSLLLYKDDKDSDFDQLTKQILPNMYKSLIVNSGILTSFPDSPNLNNPEKYKNFSCNAQDLLDENYFKPSSTDTPSTCGMASIFIKNVTYSRKKGEFSHSKTGFDASRNMIIMSLIIYLFGDKYIEMICNHKKFVPAPIPTVEIEKKDKHDKHDNRDNRDNRNKNPKYSSNYKKSLGKSNEKKTDDAYLNIIKEQRHPSLPKNPPVSSISSDTPSNNDEQNTDNSLKDDHK